MAPIRANVIVRTLAVAGLLLMAGTRVALGTGIGLLLSVRLSRKQCKVAGLALAVVGGVTTIPLAMTVLKGRGADIALLRPVV